MGGRRGGAGCMGAMRNMPIWDCVPPSRQSQVQLLYHSDASPMQNACGSAAYTGKEDERIKPHPRARRPPPSALRSLSPHPHAMHATSHAHHAGVGCAVHAASCMHAHAIRHPNHPRTLLSVLFPLPFFPMMACTSPSHTVRLTPLRICCPVLTIFAVRSFTSSITLPAAAAATMRAQRLRPHTRTRLACAGDEEKGAARRVEPRAPLGCMLVRMGKKTVLCVLCWYPGVLSGYNCLCNQGVRVTRTRKGGGNSQGVWGYVCVCGRACSQAGQA